MDISFLYFLNRWHRTCLYIGETTNMRGFVCIFIGLMWMLSAAGQSNLVLNEGFEESSLAQGSYELRKPGYLASNWYNPMFKRSPHLYNAPEESVAKANSGTSAIGLILGGSKQEKTKYEYITGELSSPLVKGQAYCVSFNVLLHRTSKWATTNIGVLLHHDKELIANVSDLTKLNASLYANSGDPISNTKWQEYNGYYVASGGEEYISFGMFGEGESIEIKELGLKSYFQLDGLKSKAYYQLDDLSVIAQSDSVDCGCAEAPTQSNDSNATGLQRYLFALDASGSMKKKGVFDSLRHNLIELVEMLPYGTPVTFSTFSSGSKFIFSGKIDQETPKKVDKLLSEVNLAGGTNVYAGLDEASKSWTSTGVDSARIILISDGGFTVSSKIEQLVKNEFEAKGRLLTIVQIESKAKGAEKLEPYQSTFIQVRPSELRNAIFHIYQARDYSAVACECIDEYTDTMNYHFVVDYSGSMKLHKGRAIKTLKKLYDQAPASAIISITAFSTSATELYVGKKSGMSLDEVEALLKEYNAKGGTDPSPGVKHGLGIAKLMAEKRFSHLIIITDLTAEKMNETNGVKGSIQRTSSEIDLAVSCVAVDLISTGDLLVSGRTQYDVTSSKFRDVSKAKFEKDLFDTERSCCDYTTQPYHYNPAGDEAKKHAKKALKAILKEALRGGTGVSIGVDGI